MEGTLAALAILACPLGMGLMMWLMGKGMMGGRGERDGDRPASAEELRREHSRIAAEIDRLESERDERDGVPG
ncbi:MAG: hypothetical protein M3N16_02460 [Actinomycetota bacterium]|nr:hypothetical protein [Actinomycetota bacterium]